MRKKESKFIKHNKDFTVYYCPYCGKKSDCIYQCNCGQHFTIIYFSCHQIYVLPENEFYDPSLKGTNKVRIFKILRGL